MSNFSVDEIKQSIKSFTIQHQLRYAELFSKEEITKLREAAVIIPLFIHEKNWHVLLTKRSYKLIEHRGQVAFPGGGREYKDENLQMTALREMREEIGVDPRDVEVLGQLGDMSVITGYQVRLFVGQIPWPYDLKINSSEVDSVFSIPLMWLVDPQHRSVEYRCYAGREISVIYFDEYEGYQLWGASAEMVMTLLTALGLAD